MANNTHRDIPGNHMGPALNSNRVKSKATGKVRAADGVDMYAGLKEREEKTRIEKLPSKKLIPRSQAVYRSGMRGNEDMEKQRG